MKHVFILGNPRSGTSLFRIMLNHHPALIAPPECGFAHWLLPKYNDWSAADFNDGRLNDYVTDVTQSKKFSTWNVAASVLKDKITELEPINYAQLVTAVYLAYKSDTSDVKAVIDKNNYYIHHLHDLITIWPDAVFFHVVRDVRDVACSYRELKNLNSFSKFKPDLPHDISEIANEWQTNNINILEFLSGLNDRTKYIRVKYEDLVTDNEATLTKVVNYLGIPFSSKMERYYENKHSELGEPVETIDWKRRTVQEPDISRVGRFKGILTKHELQVIEQSCHDLLSEFGYTLSLQ